MFDEFDVDIPTPTLDIKEGVTGYVQKFIKPNADGVVEVRIDLAPGGCSGHKYFLSELEEKLDEDVIIEKDGVKFYLDGLLYEYFDGVTVEYKEDLNGSTVEISNPKVKGSCACGTSVML